jgi:uncharacterized protein
MPETYPPGTTNSQPLASRRVTFKGAAPEGRDAPELEGQLHSFTDGTMHPGAVLCHANPAAGGHMDMRLMQAMESALAERGIATLRYNSRGVGASEGTVSTAEDKKLVAPEGDAETADVGAALDFLGMQQGVDGKRLALVGHSFGARITLAYLAKHPEDDRIQAVACIGLPVAWRNLAYLGQWPRPKLFVTGERDDFSPPGMLADFVANLPEPSTQATLKDTGHFFEGRESDLADVVSTFLERVLSAD